MLTTWTAINEKARIALLEEQAAQAERLLEALASITAAGTKFAAAAQEFVDELAVANDLLSSASERKD